MNQQDIRWQQRFSNYTKALAQLQQAVELAQQRPLSKLEEQGLIQAFEFTHELAWNTLKDFLEDRGAQNLYGSKDVTRQAFQVGLIKDGQTWMNMIQSRNLTSHTYDEATAAKISSAIRGSYFQEFELLKQQLAQLIKPEDKES